MTGFQYSTRAREMSNVPDEQRAAIAEDRDTELEDFLALRLGDGTWERPMRLGDGRLWVDSTGDLRIKTSNPTSDTDGTVVGTQT